MSVVHARAACSSRRRPSAQRGAHRLRRRRSDARRADDVPWDDSPTTTTASASTSRASFPGFEDFNARVRKPGRLPAAPTRPRRAALPHGDRQGELHANDSERSGCRPGQLLLQTVASHDQFNTTIYPQRPPSGLRVPADLFDLEPHRRATRRPRQRMERRGTPCRSFRVVAYPTARGCAAAYYPETNVLVPLDSTAEPAALPTIEVDRDQARTISGAPIREP